MRRLAVLLPALWLLTGCPSFTTMGTARTLSQGQGQLYLAAGGLRAQSFQRDEATGERLSFSLPSFELGGRVGLTDWLELGGKVWMLGAEVDGKLGLVRSASRDAGVSLALAPGVSRYDFSASGSQGTAYTWIHLPLLVGIGMPGGSELTIGPRVSDMLVRSGGDRLNMVWMGASLGYAWRVSAGLRLLPEVTFNYPVSASKGGVAVGDFEPQGAIIQVNVGALFGGD